MITDNKRIFLGMIVFPLALVLLGLLYTKMINEKVQDGGIYVVAKGLSWEPSEDLNGLLYVEMNYGGSRYIEKVGGCREGVSKYFIVLFNKDRLLQKVLFNCADSISRSTIENNVALIDMSWKQKPTNLASE